MIKNFYELKVWQDARTFPREEIFGLTSQMRRASSLITANIAEGFGRFHFKDKIRFYQQARGSAVELQNHLFLSQDLNYIKKEGARKLFQEISIVIKELNGLIRKTGENSSV
jgi:four helix bundle protein